MKKILQHLNILCFLIMLLCLFITYLSLSKNNYNGYFSKIGKTQKQIKIANFTDVSAISLQIVPVVIAFTNKNIVIYITQVLSYAITFPICKLLKITTKEPRPDDINKKNSFPSGHSALAFCGATMIFLIRKKSKKIETAITTMCFIIAIMTAIGRVLANRHWPIDIIFGSTIGIISTLISYYIVSRKHQI